MSETPSYRLELPRLIGSREKVEELTRHLPSDLSNRIVTVDALQTNAMAQCAVDELCKQLAEHRQADILLLSTSETLITRARTSARMRNFENRLNIRNAE